MVAQTAAELSLASLKGEDEDGLKSAPHNVAATPELLDPEASGKYDGVSQPRRGGALGAAEMVMDLFVRYGVEAWGIQPRPEDVGVSTGYQVRQRDLYFVGERAVDHLELLAAMDLLGGYKYQHPDGMLPGKPIRPEWGRVALRADVAP
jgi:hypothetical protein